MTGWRVLGRILAVCIVCVFVPLTGALLLAYNAQQAVITGNFLEEAFEDPAPFDLVISEAAEGLAREVPHDVATRQLPIARLDEQDWETVLRRLLPASELRAWAHTFTEEFRRWIRTGGDWTEEITLPFGDIAARLAEDPDQVVLRTLTEAQALCEPGQSPLEGPGGWIPTCRPAASELEAFYAEAASLWANDPQGVWTDLWPAEGRTYFENMPLSEFLRREGGAGGWELRQSWRWARWGIGLAGGLLTLIIVGQAVMLLGLVAIMAARNWPEALRWVGAPLALAGLFTFGLGLIAWIGAWMGPLVVFPFEHGLVDLDALTGGVSHAFGRELWAGLSFQGGILAVIGLALWVSSLFFPRAASAASPAGPAGGAGEAGSPAPTP